MDIGMIPETENPVTKTRIRKKLSLKDGFPWSVPLGRLRDLYYRNQLLLAVLTATAV